MRFVVSVSNNSNSNNPARLDVPLLDVPLHVYRLLLDSFKSVTLHWRRASRVPPPLGMWQS